MAGAVVLDGCAVATVDAAGTEYETGHVVVSGGTIVAVEGRPVVENDELRTVSAKACGADLRAAHRRLAGRLVGGAR